MTPGNSVNFDYEKNILEYYNHLEIKSAPCWRTVSSAKSHQQILRAGKIKIKGPESSFDASQLKLSLSLSPTLFKSSFNNSMAPVQFCFYPIPSSPSPTNHCCKEESG